MQGTVAVTDNAWYEFLTAHPEVTELNFWTPSARRNFRAERFSPFLFKLKAPHNAICGFAYFAQYSHLPDWLAWDSFQQGNGVSSLEALRDRIGRIRSRIRYDDSTGTNEVGCIQLVQPVFFPRAAWIRQPTDWHPRTQTYARYDLSAGEGARVWQACLEVAASLSLAQPARGEVVVPESGGKYGSPHFVTPRLGQGTFRVAVLDAYSRACCVTGEHSLPALEASHIRPYRLEGPHLVPNGLLFRADLHRLFDTGYITVTPDLRLHVGARLGADFHNGHSYYPLHGKVLHLPVAERDRPASEYLSWHNEEVFVG